MRVYLCSLYVCMSACMYQRCLHVCNYIYMCVCWSTFCVYNFLNDTVTSILEKRRVSFIVSPGHRQQFLIPFFFVVSLLLLHFLDLCMMYVYICVCVCVCLCMCAYVYVCVCERESVCECECVCVCVSVNLFVYICCR